MTDVIRIDPANLDPAAMAAAAAVLRRGGLVAFPTETVYGLGAHALDRAAVLRIFEAKARPSTDPLIVHVSSIDDAAPLVAGIPDVARALAARFWPGPLTLVLARSAAVPDEVTAGLSTVAVRVPAHPVALALLQEAGMPIAAPSANLFSRPSPTCAEHVLQDLDGRIDLVIDGGPTTVGLESTVLDLSRDVPVVLRPGAVTLEMLRELLPRVELRDTPAPEGSATPSPGMLSKHYAPRAPLTLYEGERGAAGHRMLHDAQAALRSGLSVGVIVADEDRAPPSKPARPGSEYGGWHVVHVGSRHDLTTVAPRLYAGLRELDAAGVDLILVLGFPADTGLGLAIQDRLRRAASRVLTPRAADTFPRGTQPRSDEAG